MKTSHQFALYAFGIFSAAALCASGGSALLSKASFRFDVLQLWIAEVGLLGAGTLCIMRDRRLSAFLASIVLIAVATIVCARQWQMADFFSAFGEFVRADRITPDVMWFGFSFAFLVGSLVMLQMSVQDLIRAKRIVRR